MRSFTLTALVALGLAVPSAILAQNNDWTVVQTSSAQLLDHIPRETFMGPDHWTDPAPAEYQIKVAGTELCLARTTGATIVEMPHFRLLECNTIDATQSIELSPAAVDVPLFPLTSSIRWRANIFGQCAGTARNVVFGAPRVDLNPCGMPAFTGGNIAHRGDRDQHLILRRMGRDQYRLRSDNGKCWTVGGSIQSGSQLQMENCDGRPGQIFHLVPLGGVADGPNQSAAELFGWFQAGGGGGLDRFRRLSGLDLAGSDYSSQDDANDRGRSCAAKCVRDNQCRAFTWVQPGVQGSSAKCWLKNGIPEPTANSNVISGIVRP
jgi:hypothetical protein